MKQIEQIKFICGLILIGFSIIGGLIFFLESFEFIDIAFSTSKTSQIWEDGYGEGSGASNTPIFLGLCGLAGAYLLASIKPKDTMEKISIPEEK